MRDERYADVIIDGDVHSIKIGTAIADVITSDKPCGGHGKCGKCKVLADGELSGLSSEERAHLTEKEISDGIRLACFARVMGSCTVRSFEYRDEHIILTDTHFNESKLNPMFLKYGVAIDIGTTTLAANLYSRSGELLATESDLNPQSTFGADVISRIEASLGGSADKLSRSVCEVADKLIDSLCHAASISSADIDGAVITGNTAMLFFLCRTSPESLSHAPFEADRLFGEYVSAGMLGLKSLRPGTEIWLPPCISAFVGADTVCAVLASKMCTHKSPVLLADIGTNGEMALFDGKKLLVCSTAAGPAFEGVEISMGMRGSLGAIDRVTVTDAGITCHTIGDLPPHGICGSGLVDAVAALLALGILDRSGYLEDDPVMIDKLVSLTQQDIRMVQLAKSAIYSGICTLLHEADIPFDKVSSFYIAGGFGNYLNMENAVRIGLIPGELSKCIHLIGNAALSGASMMLLDKKSIAEATSAALLAKTVDLSANRFFTELYVNSMMF